MTQVPRAGTAPARPNFGGAYTPPNPTHMDRADRLRTLVESHMSRGMSEPFAHSCAVREIEADDAASRPAHDRVMRALDTAQEQAR